LLTGMKPMLGDRRLFADSNIVLYALGDDSSKRQTVYSEDMQHGQTIEGKVIIINPFLPWPKP